MASTNTIHRTDLNKAPAPLASDVGVLTTNPKKSCYRCSQFSHDVVLTKHPIYRFMCTACKTKIFPPKL
jgi:hypothetical protein